MEQAWTIRRIVDWMTRDFSGRGMPSPRLDADLLVAHALGVERVSLYMDLDRPLTEDELGAVRGLVERRRRHEPVAYIRGHREFWGRRFEVGPAVLIPRPDTETLVEAALALLPEGELGRVADLCTGSGAVAISLAAERPGLEVDATDISAGALAVARDNAAALGVADRVTFREGDLFGPLAEDRRYRLVVANPPYVAEHELDSLAPDVVEHEPTVALVAGSDGLDIIRRIIATTPERIERGGALLLEVGAKQAGAVVEIVRATEGLGEPRTHRDLAGVERVVEAPTQ